MPKKERFLPRKIGRFNYWDFFRPNGLKTVTPLKDHIQRQFYLLLNASPAEWDEEVYPWLHKRLAGVTNRQLEALRYYVEGDKEWKQDKEVCKVYKQLSSREQADILQLSKKKWHYRSQWTWNTLLKTVGEE